MRSKSAAGMVDAEFTEQTEGPSLDRIGWFHFFILLCLLFLCCEGLFCFCFYLGNETC